jgi:hypothetical protein
MGFSLFGFGWLGSKRLVIPRSLRPTPLSQSRSLLALRVWRSRLKSTYISACLHIGQFVCGPLKFIVCHYPRWPTMG